MSRCTKTMRQNERGEDSLLSLLYCCLYSENIEAAKGGGLGRQSLRVTMDNGASLNSTSLALGSSLGFIKPGHKM